MQDLLSRLSTDLERFREIDIDHLDDLVDAVKQKDVRFAKSYDDSFPEEDVYTTGTHHSFNIVSTSFFVIFKISLPAFFKPLFVVSCFLSWAVFINCPNFFGTKKRYGKA